MKRRGSSGRARGQPPITLVDRNYPHQVELVIPGRGLGMETYDCMNYWLKGVDWQPGRGGFRNGIREVINFATYCFRSAEEADAFAAEFEGDRKTAKLASMRPR